MDSQVKILELSRMTSKIAEVGGDMASLCMNNSDDSELMKESVRLQRALNSCFEVLGTSIRRIGNEKQRSKKCD